MLVVDNEISELQRITSAEQFILSIANTRDDQAIIRVILQSGRSNLYSNAIWQSSSTARFDPRKPRSAHPVVYNAMIK